jgi:ATP-dependent Clp protease ATP-binding subunit ClpX
MEKDMMRYTEIKTSETECLICKKQRGPNSEDEGQLISLQNKMVYICEEHCDAFCIGVNLGRIELDGRLIQKLSNLKDDATGYQIKQVVYDLVPLAKRQIQEHKRLHKMTIYSPKEIYENLECHVVGQEEAKRRISLSVFEHVKQIRDYYPSVAPDKHNILLIGPSGSGKTLLAHTVAQQLELPFSSADSTSFSPTGYQGADVDSTIADLYHKAHSVVLTAEKGIVFFDELDKLGTYHASGTKGEMFNYNTQNTLLRLIEGKKVKVPIGQMGEQVNISTEQILFFFGGAFPGLVDIVAKLEGYSGRRMGFVSQQENEKYEEAMKSYEILCNASLDTLTKALMEYGLSSELIGRIPVIVPIAPLNKEQLTEYLLEIDHSPLLRQKNLFSESGYELDFTDEFVTALIDKVYQMSTGTRALTSAVKTAVSRAAFDVLTGPTRKQNGVITITQECLSNPAAYILDTPTQKVKLSKAQIVM